MDSAFTPSHRAGNGTPLVCIHGFTDTWRTWDLVRSSLEHRHDVLAVTLAGHAGGPPLGELTDAVLADEVARAMDAAGFDTAHIVGNSLGGYVSLQLAARGRARTVVALAPAGGWQEDDDTERETMAYFKQLQPLVLAAAPHADAIMATDTGRRNATRFVATNYEHIPAELLAHQLRGAAACTRMLEMLDFREEQAFTLDAEAIDCPVRVVWGTDDRILPWPAAAIRFREEWLPGADWVELEGVGHCPQLDVPQQTAQLILDFIAANGG